MEPITAGSRIATIEFDGYTVTITRPRSGFGIDRGSRSIPIGQITGIQMKDAGKWTGNGYLRLVIGGTLERRYRTSQVLKTDVLKDPNAVPFSYKQQAVFAALKEAIEQAIAQQQAGGGFQGTAPSLADELVKLQGLYRQGVLSQDEFAAAKARLLGQ